MKLLRNRAWSRGLHVHHQICSRLSNINSTGHVPLGWFYGDGRIIRFSSRRGCGSGSGGRKRRRRFGRKRRDLLFGHLVGILQRLSTLFQKLEQLLDFLPYPTSTMSFHVLDYSAKIPRIFFGTMLTTHQPPWSSTRTSLVIIFLLIITIAKGKGRPFNFFVKDFFHDLRIGVIFRRWLDLLSCRTNIKDGRRKHTWNQESITHNPTSQNNLHSTYILSFRHDIVHLS